MEAIPFALSIHHFINSVGADAGFAAIIGLAILVLLFFAQARETATLRQRAAESDEQVRQLEFRLSQISRADAPATPAPTVAPAPPGVQRPAVVPAPASVRAAPASAFVASRAVGGSPPASSFLGAPAGVAAPALSSATRLIPGDQISIRATGTAAATGAAAAAGALDGAAAAGDGNDAGGAVLAPPERQPAGPPPATAAGGANGRSTTRVPPPAPAPGPRSAGRRPSSGSPLPPPPPMASARSGVVYSRSSRGRVVAVAVAGALFVAAAIVAVLILTSTISIGSSKPRSSAAAVDRGRHHHVGVLLKPSEVNVTVLNGTTTSNLAHDITHYLDGFGYKTGTPATATDQSQTSTVVGFQPGHRAAALLVARSLKLGRASVQPVTAANKQVACPQSSGCTAQVIVTVGADLASAVTTSTAATSTAAGST